MEPSCPADHNLQIARCPTYWDRTAQLILDLINKLLVRAQMHSTSPLQELREDVLQIPLDFFFFKKKKKRKKKQTAHCIKSIYRFLL